MEDYRFALLLDQLSCHDSIVSNNLQHIDSSGFAGQVYLHKVVCDLLGKNNLAVCVDDADLTDAFALNVEDSIGRIGEDADVILLD